MTLVALVVYRTSLTTTSPSAVIVPCATIGSLVNSIPQIIFNGIINAMIALVARYHGLSHHGNDAQKISEYNLVGIEHVRRFESFLQKLRSTKDVHDRTLLDTTAVVFGSGMGDANTHDNSNLPTLLVGGGFQHGAHRHFQRSSPSPRLLGDLFLTLMGRFGIQIESFAGATHNIDEVLL